MGEAQQIDLPSLPATHAERGATPGFTTDLLRHARIRQGSGGLEVLVPGLQVGERYVLPARECLSHLTLTLLDRELIEVISAGVRLDPPHLAAARQRVAACGFGGSAEQARARADSGIAADFAVVLNVALIKTTVDHIAARTPGTPQLHLREIMTVEGQATARRLIGAMVRKSGVSGGEVLEDTAEWAELLRPLGLPKDPFQGPLRKVLNELDRMSHEVSEWGRREAPDIRVHATCVADGARLSVGLCKGHLARIDGHMYNLAAALGMWPQTALAIKADMDALHWTLDGWAPILARWHQAIDQGPAAMVRAIKIAARFVPLPAADELNPADFSAFDALNHFRAQLGPFNASMLGVTTQALGELEPMFKYKVRW